MRGFLTEFQRFGLVSEKRVTNELMSRDFICTWPSDFNARYDVMVNDCLPIHVKAARARRHKAGRRGTVVRNRWQFRVSNINLNRPAIVIFVAWCPTRLYWYIVPTEDLLLKGVKSINITSHPEHFSGWLDQYRDRWDLISRYVPLCEWRQALAAGQLKLSI
jgi:hypothetical protein